LTLLGLIFMLMKARNRPVVSGSEKIVGDYAEVIEDFTGHGTVFLEGERWMAESATELSKGQRVKVIAIDGLTVRVEPAQDS